MGSRYFKQLEIKHRQISIFTGILSQHYSMFLCFIIRVLIFFTMFINTHTSFIVSLSVYTTGILFRELSPVTMCSRLFPMFFSVRFSINEFMMRCFIHLNLNFVQGDRYQPICILPHFLIHLCQHHAVFIIIPLS